MNETDSFVEEWIDRDCLSCMYLDVDAEKDMPCKKCIKMLHPYEDKPEDVYNRWKPWTQCLICVSYQNTDVCEMCTRYPAPSKDKIKASLVIDRFKEEDL